jgi:hypothetical protein
LRKTTKFLALAVAIIFVGLVLITIAFSEIPQSSSILDQNILVKLDSPYTSFAVSPSYYLGGAHGGKITGTLQSSDCCIDFLIFTNAAWTNWMANGMKATNVSNSPSLAVDYNLIKSPTPVPFAFIPNSSTIYTLAFFNNNRSQWNVNSSVVMHVFANILISYTKATTTFLVYPGIVLLIAGIVVIVWTRFLSRP